MGVLSNVYSVLDGLGLKGLPARWRLLLVRLAVVGGLIGAFAVVGYVAANRSITLAIAISAMPLALLLMAQSPQRSEVGVIAILAAAAFVRFTIPTGTESEIVASLALTGLIFGLWVVRMLLEYKRIWLEPSAVNLPILGFVAVSVIALVWSVAFRDILVVVWSSFPFVQLASLGVIILLPGAILLMSNLVKDLKWIKVMVWIMLITGVIGLMQEWWRIPIRANILGLYPMWAVCISFSWALFDRKLRLWQRGLLLAFTASWIWYGYFRRVAWLVSWAPSFAVIALLSFRRTKWSLMATIPALLFVAYRYRGASFNLEMMESGQTRWAAWIQNWQVTSKHLLFGTGPAGYAAYYMSYYPLSGMATHSNYIDILAQTGIVGLAFFLWIFGTLLWRGYRICRRLQGRGDYWEGLANAVFAGTVGCVLAMGLGDWLIPFAYTTTIAAFDYAVYCWLLMGIIPILDRATQVQPFVSSGTGEVLPVGA